jgi:hypothetical protein
LLHGRGAMRLAMPAAGMMPTTSVLCVVMPIPAQLEALAER